jgi:EpsI family protein
MAGTGLLAGVPTMQAEERDSASLNLDALFPLSLGSWRTSGAANAFVRPANEPTYRIYEQVLERTYVNSEGWPIMLSVAYGGAQSDGLQMHRPELCYRYSGFSVRTVLPVEIETRGKVVEANRVFAELPGRPEPITYWTTLRGESVRDANTFRLITLSYAVRRIQADGMLVRVSSIDPLIDRAYALHDAFIRALESTLSPERSSLVFGRSRASSGR